VISRAPRPTLCAIVGDHAVGKRRLARGLADWFGSDQCTLLALDDYAVPPAADAAPRPAPTRDPAAINLALMAQHLRLLRQGETVFKPVLERSNGRLGAPEFLRPTPIILAFGLHGLATPELRSLWDVSLFVAREHGDAPADARIASQRDRADAQLAVCTAADGTPTRYEFRATRAVPLPAVDALRDSTEALSVAEASAGTDVVRVEASIDDVTAARIEAQLLAALPEAPQRRARRARGTEEDGPRGGAEAIAHLVVAHYLLERGMPRAEVSSAAARSAHPAPGA
jgi:uridine kinase